MNTPLWRPLAPENIRDPYGMYANLRDVDPVHHAQTGEYIVTRYHDIRNILKNPSFRSGNRLLWLEKGIQYFDTKKEDFSTIRQAMNSFILMLNDDQHARVRNFISRCWNDRNVDEIIHINIEKVMNNLPGKAFDLVTDYAQHVPVLTIANILGVPVTDYQHLMHLGVSMTKALDLYVTLKDLVMMNEAAKEFIRYFRDQIREKSDRHDHGLLSRLIRKNQQEKAGLSEEELISIGIFLFTAGEETSAGLISTALLHLARFPEQKETLHRHPEQIARAIEEVLRYDSVVQLLGRIADDDVQVGDKLIPKGTPVTLAVGSGNRDEEVFKHADVFNISRNPNRHLSFGNGLHYCLGDWLGRRQSQLSVNAFLQRYPDFTIPEQDLSWYKNIAIRRLDRLTVKV